MLYRLVSRRGLSLSFAALILAAFSPFSLMAGLAIPPVEPGQFHFHHENILGTSLDLIVRADTAATAAKVEQAVLAEIERLRKILSTYDPASEISRLNSATGPMSCSPELLDVLNAYESWTSRSHGAYSGQLGELIATWRAAEKSGTPPAPATLANIVRSLSAPGWTINAADGTVTRRASAQR